MKRHSLVAATLMAALALAGCTKTRACKSGTVLLALTLDSMSQAADQLEISASVGSGTLTTTVAHSPSASGSLELDFAAGYPANQSLTLTVTAVAAGQTVGSGTLGPVQLPSGCAHFSLHVSDGVVGDGGGTTGDLGDAGAGSDMSGNVANACSPMGTVRCKPTDHSFQQVCDATLQWKDSPCPSVATPPSYACTEAKNKCIDPAWVQWGYKTIPSPRFTTVTDTSGAGEDIIKDALTGLYWQLKHPDATYTWSGSQAQTYCSGLSYGGFDDWRLPTATELTTIVDYTQDYGTNPVVAAPFMTFTKMEAYWSSNPDTSIGNEAYTVDFTEGKMLLATQTEMHRARCVR